MQKFFIFFFLATAVSFSQTISECRQRFDAYLNFRGSLNHLVKFDNESISIYSSAGKREYVFYAQEIGALADFFEHSTLKQQEQLLAKKGTRRYTRRECDSLLISVDDRKKLPKQVNALPLQGFRVAVDPGHFSTTLKEAQIEQKYLYFVKDSINNPYDSIKLFESALTFNTARHLQTMLEAQGATVLLTRSQAAYTSFNCTYSEWLARHKARMLDSLKTSQRITGERYKQLVKLSDYKLFWEFFRDYDLANRANKINRFNPHVSVIIHYNVDETNDPWKKHSDKNYTMAFIGGAFTADYLSNAEGRTSFLRLLLTRELNQSEALAKETVMNFHKNLGIPVAGQLDAVYLKDNCLATASAGVFSRNLVLCRKINSPLVYGESLYQDNKNESTELMKNDLDVFGIKSNLRLSLVAKSYYEAVYDFLVQKQK